MTRELGRVRRSAILAYGIFCYVAFVLVSTYALGFVGNTWAVFGWERPFLRSLDGRAETPFARALVTDLALIALFGVQHSVMARRWFKEWARRFVPPALERSTYVLVSSACLVVLFWHWQPIGFVLWDVSGGAAGWALVVVSLAGWAVAARATFLIDHAELFGLRQVVAAFRNRSESARAEFKTPGLYRAVRHPLYLGFLVAFWASPVMTVGHLVFAAALTLYVLVAIPLEERDLVAQFGDRYRDYQKRVRALLPFPRSR